MFKYINLRYVLQRILIGTGIILLVSFVKSGEVNAASWEVPQSAVYTNVSGTGSWLERQEMPLTSLDDGTKGLIGNGYTYGTYGTAITICPSYNIILGHVYTLSLKVKFLDSNNNYLTYSSKMEPKVRLVNDLWSDFTNYSGSYVLSASSNYSKDTWGYNVEAYSTIFNVTYKPESTLNVCNMFFINSSNTTNSNASIFIEGYKLTDNGTDYSGEFNNVNDNIDEMEDSINNNINENFNNCRDSKNLFEKFAQQGYIKVYEDVIIPSTNFQTSYYIKVKPNTTYVISSPNSDITRIFRNEYNSSKVYNSTLGRVETSNGQSFTTSSTTEYIKFSINSGTETKVQLEESSSASEYEPYGEICENRLDSVNDSINDLNDNITDSNTDNDKVANTINGIEIGDKGVITNLITMPITFFQSILNNIEGSCTTFNLGNLFGTDLTMPCINIENYLGSNLWNVIDILFSGFFILYVSRKVVKVFESFTNLKEGDVLDD